MTETALGFDTLQSRLRFSGELIARTGLRIGAGRDTDVAGHDLPVMRNANGQPFIPGASFKGVLRAQVEALLRGLSDDPTYQREKLACYVLERDQRCIPDKTLKQWRQDLVRDEEMRQRVEPEIARRVLGQSCLVCQTFGSTYLAAHVAIRDLTVQPNQWFGQFEVRQGVSLDRDTETAREGQLYSFETVPPGTRFQLEIVADNLLGWQKGLLLLGLQPFMDGTTSLGGARSRGLGQVQLLNGAWHGWEQTANRVDSVMAFLRADLPALDRAVQDGWKEALHARLTEVTRV
jgi:CRISPR-associated RAMP protein (TIGR02581 family)